MSPAEQQRAQGFTSLKVEKRPGSREWTLTEDLYWTDPDGNGHRVPKGFVTDFASVPRIFRGVVLLSECTAEPATLHDYDYRVTRPGRKWADDRFYHTLKSVGVSTFWAYVYWLAVRWGGWLAYHRPSSRS